MENTEIYLTTSELALLFGLTAQRVYQLRKDGIIKNENGKYDLFPTVQAYTQYLAARAEAREKKQKTADLQKQKLRAETTLKQSRAELYQLKAAIQAGKYISLDEVQADYSSFYGVFKKFALAIPGRVAGVMQGAVPLDTARTIKQNLTREIKALLRGFVVAGSVYPADTGE